MATTKKTTKTVKKTQDQELPPMKKNGYAFTYDKWIGGKNEDFAEKVYPVVNTNNFHHFLDSVSFQRYKEVYISCLEQIKEDFRDVHNKKQVSEKDFNSMKSLAINFVFRMFDQLSKNDERKWEIEHIIESYFDNDKIHFILGLAFGLMTTEVENTKYFVPKMDWEKAYDKMLKWYVKPEATDFQVPQKIKYNLAKVKQHIDTYMWEEFLKQEYYTAKLTGLDDESIIDLFDNPTLIMKFCDWCKGYKEGVNEN